MVAVLVRALLKHPQAKVVAFCVALMPLGWLIFAALTSQLGSNPAEALVRSTGDWALRFLCAALAITPLRVLTGTPVLARFRRMVGLFVFFYGVMHAMSYSWFDMGFDLSDIGRDIFKRPFILVGFTSLVLLAALAATSSQRAVKALGGPRWRNLHRLVYVVAILAMLHFFWMRAAKNNFAEVAVYAMLLGAMLVWRAIQFAKKSGR